MAKSPRKNKARPRGAPARAARAKAKAPTAGRRVQRTRAASPVIGSLGLVTLHVNDYDRALEFYRDTLELTPVSEMPEVGWAQFRVGHADLGVHADNTEEGSRKPGGASGFYFHVPDVDRAVEALRERGVKIADEPEDKPYGRDATFLDPDGNVLAVMTRKP